MPFWQLGSFRTVREEWSDWVRSASFVIRCSRRALLGSFRGLAQRQFPVASTRFVPHVDRSSFFHGTCKLLEICGNRIDTGLGSFRRIRPERGSPELGSFREIRVDRTISGLGSFRGIRPMREFSIVGISISDVRALNTTGSHGSPSHNLQRNDPRNGVSVA